MFRAFSRLLLGASLVFSSASVLHAQGLIGVDYSSGTLYNISTTTAALTPIGSTGVPLFADIQFAPNGTLYGFTSDTTPTLYRIDPTTAQATAIGPIGLGQVTEGGMTIAPNGTAYATNVELGTNMEGLFTMNLATGAGTTIGVVSGGPHDINGLAYRSDGELVALDKVTNSLLLINPNTATATTLAVLSQAVGSVGGMTIVNGVGYFDTGGPLTAFPGSNSLYSFDPFTGANTLIGSFSPTINGIGISGITAMPASTPEPGPVALLVGMSISGVGFLARRRKQARKAPAHCA